jgi:hypothetical protein
MEEPAHKVINKINLFIKRIDKPYTSPSLLLAKAGFGSAANSFGIENALSYI